MAYCNDISERCYPDAIDNGDGMLIMRLKLKSILAAGDPSIIGGNKEKGNVNKDHFALVVSYVKNCEEEYFVVLDPYHTKPLYIKMTEFYNPDWYPNAAAQFDNQYILRTFLKPVNWRIYEK